MRDTTQNPTPHMQPIEIAADGVVRFRENKIVRFLLDAGPFDMNQLALMRFDRANYSEFAQLIGYSVSGYGDLSYADPDVVAAADRIADALIGGES